MRKEWRISTTIRGTLTESRVGRFCLERCQQLIRLDTANVMIVNKNDPDDLRKGHSRDRAC